MGSQSPRVTAGEGKARGGYREAAAPPGKSHPEGRGLRVLVHMLSWEGLTPTPPRAGSPISLSSA